MTEVLLFLVMAFIAVVAAVAMLVSENAVHSALFLIVNFACVAFLYLMLNAPFLAMIQIAVYAGAIMVLFLFVIMLLGAERTTDTSRKFRWLNVTALFLAVLFLITAAWGLTSGKIDLQPPAESEPALRVVHAHSPQNAFPLDVYVDGELVASNLRFRDVVDFKKFSPGDHTVTLNPSGTQAAIVTNTITLEPGDAKTIIAYGTSPLPVLAVVDDDLSTVSDRRSGRVTIFNAYEGLDSVRLVDLGVNQRLDTEEDADGKRTIRDQVLLENITAGTVSEPVEVREGRAVWAFVTPGGAVLTQLREPLFDVQRNTSKLIVLMNESLFDGSQRAVAQPLVVDAQPSFGSPEAIGQLLFSTYLLPFELVAILLLAAMIGAVVLAHREPARIRPRRSLRRKVSRPLTSVIAAQTGRDLGTTPETEPRELAGD